MNILVIADHNNAELDAATAHTVAAAHAIGGDITVLVAGHNCDAAAQQAASLEHVSTVLVADQPFLDHQLAENVGELVAQLGINYSHILAATTTDGKNALPRAAALLDVEPLSDVIAVESPDTFKRPIYAGNAIATVKMDAPIKMMTIRGTGFDPVAKNGAATVKHITDGVDLALSEFVDEQAVKSDRPSLTAAKVVVSGGRGMGNGDNFELLYKVADKLQAAVGASRAAVDAGFVPNELQVGQTGKIVAPQLYIAVGISGAIQHLAGMKESKVIVAINKDEEAPIFAVADYGLVMDLFEALPQLESQLS